MEVSHSRLGVTEALHKGIMESVRSELEPTNQHNFLPAVGDQNEIDISREDQFLEESFAVYNNAVVSVYPSKNNLDGNEGEDLSFVSRTTADLTFMSNTSYDSFNSPAPVSKALLKSLPSQIENLNEIPKPEYITRIAPQTVTVNLIVGIISVVAPRTVQLRRYDGTMDIVEVIVGDETRTGFSIKFWLPPSKPDADEDPLRKVLQNLRTRDVVLVQNVALHVWQNSVYGQSLSKRISRNETKVELLGRDGEVDLETTAIEISPQVAKVKKVSDWIIAFLGTSGSSRTNKKGKEASVVAADQFSRLHNIELPPETP